MRLEDFQKLQPGDLIVVGVPPDPDQFPKFTSAMKPGMKAVVGVPKEHHGQCWLVEAKGEGETRTFVYRPEWLTDRLTEDPEDWMEAF